MERGSEKQEKKQNNRSVGKRYHGMKGQDKRGLSDRAQKRFPSSEGSVPDYIGSGYYFIAALI